MESLTLLTGTLHSTTTTAVRKRHKANGTATAALLIQIAAEMLQTSPTLRKQMGITLTDLVAADKVRRELLRKPALVSQPR